MSVVTPKTTTTSELQKSLELFADENSLVPAECDFKILKTDTYVRSNVVGEFEHYTKDILEKYLDKDKILNEHIEFVQRHEVTFFKKEQQRLKLHYKIVFDANSIHPSIIIFEDSEIPFKEFTPKELLNALFIEINKIKALTKILIRIFDAKMIEKLKLFVKYIYSGKFTKRVRLTLFEGIEPTIAREGKIVRWFEKKEQKSQVLEVDAGEVLIEYIKPIFGSNGFNAFGKIVSAQYYKNEHDIAAEIDGESITIEEDELSKRYIAKKQGYLHYNEKYLCVNNKIHLDQISRNAKAVASQEANSIEVKVSQHDTNRDSIGEGVQLTSERIHVEGFVGAKSHLEAMQLSIDGATHQDSLQFAKEAHINRHKGTLRCQHAKIKLLEGGEVHATTAEIESSLGGTIYAQDVVLGHIKSNLKVYASNSITVKLISGEDNLLHIGCQKIPILKSKVGFIKEDIQDLKYHLEEATRHHPERVKGIQNEIKELQEQIRRIEESYKTASIIIEQPLKGLNTIIFYINQEQQIVYKTQAQTYSKFYLEITENKITLHPVNKSISLQN